MKQFLILMMLLLPQAAFSAEDEGDAPKKVPSYVSLGKSMIINLATTKKRLTFLQLKVDVLVDGEDAKLIVESHVPAIRHEILLLLSEQNALDMKTPSKRNDIRKLATQQVIELMDELAENANIEDVLFSSFLIQ